MRFSVGSLVIGLDPGLLLAVDHEGRPWRLVDGDRTFRWGLNGHVLRIERLPGRGRTYRWVESDEAVALWERTRDRLSLLLDSAISGDLPDLELVPGPGGGAESISRVDHFTRETGRL
ncbi:hypothetical protein ACFL6T_00505 [Candidatus Zixiibacteriota bacterium]